MPAPIPTVAKLIESITTSLVPGLVSGLISSVNSNDPLSVLNFGFSSINSVVSTGANILSNITGINLKPLGRDINNVVSSIGSITTSLYSVISAAEAFNNKILQMQINLASESSIFAASGEQISDSLQKIESLKAASANFIDQLQKDTMLLAGTTSEGITNVAQAIFSNLSKVQGQLIKKDGTSFSSEFEAGRELAISISSAMGNLGLPTYQIAQETKGLLTGDFSPNSVLATSRISKADYEKARSRGQGVDYLISELSTDTAANEIKSKTLSNVVSNILLDFPQQLIRSSGNAFTPNVISQGLEAQDALFNSPQKLQLQIRKLENSINSSDRKIYEYETQNGTPAYNERNSRDQNISRLDNLKAAARANLGDETFTRYTYLLNEQSEIYSTLSKYQRKEIDLTEYDIKLMSERQGFITDELAQIEEDNRSKLESGAAVVDSQSAIFSDGLLAPIFESFRLIASSRIWTDLLDVLLLITDALAVFVGILFKIANLIVIGPLMAGINSILNALESIGILPAVRGITDVISAVASGIRFDPNVGLSVKEKEFQEKLVSTKEFFTFDTATVRGLSFTMDPPSTSRNGADISEDELTSGNMMATPRRFLSSKFDPILNNLTSKENDFAIAEYRKIVNVRQSLEERLPAVSNAFEKRQMATVIRQLDNTISKAESIATANGFNLNDIVQGRTITARPSAQSQLSNLYGTSYNSIMTKFDKMEFKAADDLPEFLKLGQTAYDNMAISADEFLTGLSKIVSSRNLEYQYLIQIREKIDQISEAENKRLANISKLKTQQVELSVTEGRSTTEELTMRKKIEEVENASNQFYSARKSFSILETQSNFATKDQKNIERNLALNRTDLLRGVPANSAASESLEKKIDMMTILNQKIISNPNDTVAKKELEALKTAFKNEMNATPSARNAVNADVLIDQKLALETQNTALKTESKKLIKLLEPERIKLEMAKTQFEQKKEELFVDSKMGKIKSEEITVTTNNKLISDLGKTGALSQQTADQLTAENAYKLAQLKLRESNLILRDSVDNQFKYGSKAYQDYLTAVNELIIAQTKLREKITDTIISNNELYASLGKSFGLDENFSRLNSLQNESKKIQDQFINIEQIKDNAQQKVPEIEAQKNKATEVLSTESENLAVIQAKKRFNQSTYDNQVQQKTSSYETSVKEVEAEIETYKQKKSQIEAEQKYIRGQFTQTLRDATGVAASDELFDKVAAPTKRIEGVGANLNSIISEVYSADPNRVLDETTKVKIQTQELTNSVFQSLRTRNSINSADDLLNTQSQFSQALTLGSNTGQFQNFRNENLNEGNALASAASIVGTLEGSINEYARGPDTQLRRDVIQKLQQSLGELRIIGGNVTQEGQKDNFLAKKKEIELFLESLEKIPSNIETIRTSFNEYNSAFTQLNFRNDVERNTFMNIYQSMIDKNKEYGDLTKKSPENKLKNLATQFELDKQNLEKDFYSAKSSIDIEEQTKSSLIDQAQTQVNSLTEELKSYNSILNNYKEELNKLKIQQLSILEQMDNVNFEVYKSKLAIDNKFKKYTLGDGAISTGVLDNQIELLTKSREYMQTLSFITQLEQRRVELAKAISIAEKARDSSSYVKFSRELSDINYQIETARQQSANKEKELTVAIFDSIRARTSSIIEEIERAKKARDSTLSTGILQIESQTIDLKIAGGDNDYLAFMKNLQALPLELAKLSETKSNLEALSTRAKTLSTPELMQAELIKQAELQKTQQLELLNASQKRLESSLAQLKSELSTLETMQAQSNELQRQADLKDKMAYDSYTERLAEARVQAAVNDSANNPNTTPETSKKAADEAEEKFIKANPKPRNPDELSSEEQEARSKTKQDQENARLSVVTQISATQTQLDKIKSDKLRITDTTAKIIDDIKSGKRTLSKEETEKEMAQISESINAGIKDIIDYKNKLLEVEQQYTSLLKKVIELQTKEQSQPFESRKTYLDYAQRSYSKISEIQSQILKAQQEQNQAEILSINTKIQYYNQLQALAQTAGFTPRDTSGPEKLLAKTQFNRETGSNPLISPREAAQNVARREVQEKMKLRQLEADALKLKQQGELQTLDIQQLQLQIAREKEQIELRLQQLQLQGQMRAIQLEKERIVLLQKQLELQLQAEEQGVKQRLAQGLISKEEAEELLQNISTQRANARESSALTLSSLGSQEKSVADQLSLIDPMQKNADRNYQLQNRLIQQQRQSLASKQKSEREQFNNESFERRIKSEQDLVRSGVPVRPSGMRGGALLPDFAKADTPYTPDSRNQINSPYTEQKTPDIQPPSTDLQNAETNIGKNYNSVLALLDEIGPSIASFNESIRSSTQALIDMYEQVSGKKLTPPPTTVPVSSDSQGSVVINKDGTTKKQDLPVPNPNGLPDQLILPRNIPPTVLPTDESANPKISFVQPNPQAINIPNQSPINTISDNTASKMVSSVESLKQLTLVQNKTQTNTTTSPASLNPMNNTFNIGVTVSSNQQGQNISRIQKGVT